MCFEFEIIINNKPFIIVDTGSKTGDQPAKINIVMELCENGSLEVYLQHLEAAANNSLTNSRDIYVDQFVLWGTQIASGMEFLGNHGVF